MFISVDLPAPFSPSSAWTSPLAEIEVDVVVGEHAREPLRDPAQLEQGASATARSYPDGGRPLASSCAAALARTAVVGEIRGSSLRMPTAPLAAPKTRSSPPW